MKPETIIEIIKKEYLIDITKKTRKREYSDLRMIYFYLCRRYCVEYSMDSIASKVGRLSSNAVLMTQRFLDKINLRGYEDLNLRLKKISNIIENDYKKNEDVIMALKIQDYNYLDIQKKHIKAMKRIKYIDCENRRLNTKLNKLKDKLNAC